MYNHFRRLVIDLDDTISKTYNRDFGNAEPITGVVDKVNYLYENGWEIIILTARGQLSCSGDHILADKKYRKQIEGWLKKNGVKYHKLSFNKILAAYYVDDKGLSPEQFSELDIKVIKNGWSGAIIEKRGDLIYKQHPGINAEAYWYSLVKDIVSTPNLVSVIGDTICLKFIDNVGSFNIRTINEIIKKFSNKGHYSPDFDSYIKRIESHLMYNEDFWEILEPLKENSEFFNGLKSFCHGDLSMDNVLVNGKGEHYLIDPIFDPNCYSSWVLDASKMLHSLRRYSRTEDYEFLFSQYEDIVGRERLLLLEVTQFIRTLKYIKDMELKLNFIQIIKSLMNELNIRNK